MGPNKDISSANPFPGLRPFTPEDSEVYFGRDSECEELLSALLKNGYATVIGAAGVGKTSLVFGGLIGKILAANNENKSQWRIINTTPGNDPFGNLAAAILGCSTGAIDNDGNAALLSDLYNEDTTLDFIIKKHLPKTEGKTLIVIDQFEELFRYFLQTKPEENIRAVSRYNDLIVNSAGAGDKAIYILITIRSEFLGEISRFRDLAKLINKSSLLLSEMKDECLRDAIKGPAALQGVEIEPGLCDRLIKDSARIPFRMPVLAHVMMRTYNFWKSGSHDNRLIGSDSYESTGQIGNALDMHCEELYNSLDLHEKEICSSVFRALTSKTRDGRSSLNATSLSTLQSVARCSARELDDFLAKFSGGENSIFVTRRHNSSIGNDFVDLQSECVTTRWNRLKEWIEAESSARDMYLKLSDSSALYQQGKANLLKQPELGLALAWRDKFKPYLAWAVQYNPAFERAMVYLRTSEKNFLAEEENRIRQQQVKARNTRIITRILSITALLGISFFFFEYFMKLSAQKQVFVAENQRVNALRDKNMADSFAIIVLQQKMISDSTATVSAKEADDAKMDKLLSETELSDAMRKIDVAEHQKNIAKKQNDSIKELNRKAEEKAIVAANQKVEAQRLRMLSLGKSMSVRSLQMNDQKDIQALLAYQAYLFNKRNNGQANDADIFAGLYHTMKQNGNISYKSFKGQTGDIKSLAFIPGRSEFFTSGSDGNVMKWSLGKADQTLQVMYSGSDIIDVLAVSPDETWLACGSSNSTIRMIPLRSNTEGYNLSGHKGSIKSLIFSYDGKFLYSAALDGKVLKWDIAAKTSVNVSTGAVDITSIDLSPTGSYMAGLGTDGKVTVWNPERNEGGFRIETAGKNIRSIRFNPDNNLLALGDSEGTVEFWDVVLKKKVAAMKVLDGQVNSIAFNAGHKQMATTGSDKKLRLFDVSNTSDLSGLPITFDDNSGFILAMQFSPDGQIIVTGNSGGIDNLIGRPTNSDYLVRNICNIIKRDMTQDEWNNYVARDIPVEKTCQNNNYNIKVEQIKKQ